MKTNPLITISGVLLLFLPACTSNENQVIKEIPFGQTKITQITTDLFPAESREVKLSEIISRYDVIQLETKAECMISNTNLQFAKDFILIGTQNFPGAARLYRFGYDGRFINEIGSPGRGPGEHNGYYADVIRCYEDSRRILVTWNGSEGPQVFDFDGKFIEEVTEPVDLMRYIERWSDSLWFSTGSFAGNVLSERDSLALIFYNSKGRIIKTIPRREYPPAGNTGYTPSPWDPSVYIYNGIWKLYMQGNDTIFKIENMGLVPDGLLLPDRNSLTFNRTSPPDGQIGKTSFSILSETEENWFINKTIITEAKINEWKPGQWGGSFRTDRHLIIIDKKSRKAIDAKLTDDIFHLFTPEMLAQGVRWQDNRFSIAMQATYIPKLLEGLKDQPASKEANAIIDQLRAKPVDDNPVIFLFTLKDRIKVTE